MSKNFDTKEILSEIDTLLDSSSMININSEKQVQPLILKSEIKDLKQNKDSIPKDTEKIILDAEKHFKR